MVWGSDYRSVAMESDRCQHLFPDLLISVEAWSALSVAEQELYNSYPLRTEIASAIAVFGDTIGS